MTIQTPTSWVALIKNLQRAIRNIDQYVKQLIHSEYKERRKRFAARLDQDPAGGREFRAIRESPARPIQFLVDNEGILQTDPMKTDSIMTKQKFTKAPTGLTNRCSRTSEFSILRTCTERTSSQSPTSQLRNSATHSDTSKTTQQAQTNGKMLHSDTPLRWLATMLNEIEKGMKWPRQITEAHATCIPKESRTSHDPLAYRVLPIMSQIYRKYGPR